MSQGRTARGCGRSRTRSGAPPFRLAPVPYGRWRAATRCSRGPSGGYEWPLRRRNWSCAVATADDGAHDVAALLRVIIHENTVSVGVRWGHEGVKLRQLFAGPLYLFTGVAEGQDRHPRESTPPTQPPASCSARRPTQQGSARLARRPQRARSDARAGAPRLRSAPEPLL